MLLENQSLKLGKYIKDYREDDCQLCSVIVLKCPNQGIGY